MTSKELDYIIQEGESYLIEFKERGSFALKSSFTRLSTLPGIMIPSG